MTSSRSSSDPGTHEFSPPTPTRAAPRRSSAPCRPRSTSSRTRRTPAPSAPSDPPPRRAPAPAARSSTPAMPPRTATTPAPSSTRTCARTSTSLCTASRSPGPTGPSATRRHRKMAFANGSAATRARAGLDSARSATRFPRLRPSTSAPPSATAPAKKDPRRRRSADDPPRLSPSRRTVRRSPVTRTWTGR